MSEPQDADYYELDDEERYGSQTDEQLAAEFLHSHRNDPYWKVTQS